MKAKLVISLFFIFYGYNASSQEHNFTKLWTTYTNNYVPNVIDVNTNVAVDSNNSIYITKANMQYFNEGVVLGSLSKFSADGELIWTSETFGQTDGLVIDQNGDIIISGHTSRESGIATVGTFQDTYGGGNGDGFLMKFSENGEKIWGTYFGGLGYEYGNYAYFLGLEVTADNDIIYSSRIASEGMATAGTFQEERNGAEYAISKFTSNGQREWTTYYGTGDVYEYVIGGLQVDGSDIYITGWVRNDSIPNAYFDTFGNYNFEPDSKELFVTKFDSTGNRVWSRYLHGNGDEYARRHALALVGDYLYVTFSSTSTDFGTEGTSFPDPGDADGPGVLVKMDLEGNTMWSTYLPDSVFTPSNNPGVYTDGDNGIYAMGSTIATDDGILGMFTPEIEDSYTQYIMKFTAEGEMIWGNYFGNSDNTEWFHFGMAFYDRGIFTYGDTEGSANIATEGAFQENPYDEGSNTFLSKYKGDTLNVENFGVASFTAYPIPASTFLNLKLNKNFNFPVITKLYNTLGQLVKVQNSNELEVSIDVSSISSGVYFLEVGANDKVERKKILID